jgi:hypothetical protein
MERLASLVRNTCRRSGNASEPTFQLITQPDPTPRRALDLLQDIRL